MATTIKPFPHYQINVKDNSIYTVEYSTILPVHRPLWLIPAQEGPVNDPVWCPNYQVAVSTFGKGTFTNTSRYFSPGAKVLKDILTYNGAFICRLTDDTAKASFIILEAWVRIVDDIPNYVRTETGRYAISSSTGKKYLPYEDGDSRNTLPGVEITYRTRSFWRSEELDGDVPLYDYGTIPKQDDIGGYTVYPIMVFSALYPGAYGDDLGFSLYWKANGANMIGNVEYYKSMFYSIAPFRREDGKTSTVPVRDIYNSVETTFAARPDAINLDTGLEMSLQAIATRTYNDDTHQLPYSIYTYEENIKAIAEFFVKNSSEASKFKYDDYVADKGLDGGFIEDNFCITGEDVHESAIVGPGDDTRGLLNTFGGYVINIFTGKNTSNIPYRYLRVCNVEDAPDITGFDNAQPISLLDETQIYLAGGADGKEYGLSGENTGTPVSEKGKFDDVAFQDLMIKFLNLDVNPTIIDPFRYPFTHIYDIGYNLDVKYAMIDFLDTRDDVMVELSTQELWRNDSSKVITLNDTATDITNAIELRNAALMHRESLLKGTECCRCAIYAHAGFLVDNTYTAPLPIGTYWSAMKHAQLGNLPYMNPREPRGWPDSYNEYFKVNSINWINYDPEIQSRAWNGGVNYIQWADMSRVFYPALRTVYREDTSVLCDQWFVDAVVYTKHVVRTAWGRYTGRNDRVAVLQRAIKEYLEGQLGTLYSGKYSFEVSVYQTAEEQKIGYIQHVLIRITSPATMRVLDVDIEVNREGYNPEEE